MKTHSQLLFIRRFAWSRQSRNSPLAHWHRVAVLAVATLALLLGFTDAGAQKAAPLERSSQQANGSSQDASQAGEPVGSLATPSVISSVIIGQESGRASVLVKGKGPLEAHVARMQNPDRLVLDFASTHLSVREPVIMDVGPPVRNARLSQYRPDVARVVIDLTPATSYTISRGEGNLFIFIYTDRQSVSPTEDSRSTRFTTQQNLKRHTDPYYLPGAPRLASHTPMNLQVPPFPLPVELAHPAIVLSAYSFGRESAVPFAGVTRQAAQNQKPATNGQQLAHQEVSAQDPPKPQNPFEPSVQTQEPGGAPAKQDPQVGRQQPATSPSNPPQAAPPPEVSSQGKQELSVALNLENADLYQVLRIIGSELRINYVVDPSVKGTVTINTSGPISRTDLFSLLESILQINGAAIVKQDGYYRVVPAGDAKAQPVPLEFVKSAEAPPLNGETLVLEVFPMHFVSAVDMSKVIAPFISPVGQVIVNEKGHLLLVMETPPKLKQVSDILGIFDNSTFSRQRVRLYSVANNSAKTIITELQDVFGGYSLTGSSSIRFVAMDSLNAVLAISPSPEAFADVETWIHQLDQPAQQAGEQNFVYSVQNAKASDLRDILIELYGGSTQKPQPQPVSGSPLNPTNPMVSPAALEEAQRAQAPQVPERVQGRLRIMSDDKNNALIIQASPHDYEIVKRTIAQLDILPRQVLIDAKIYEVNLTGNLSLGISYFLNEKGKLPGPLGTSGSFSGGQSGGSLQATTFAVISQTRALQMFLNATDQRSRVRMLSAPSILVTDNTNARIQVGASVPVPIGSALTPVQSSGSSIFAQTIQYQDTGVILTVTPHINASGVVTLSLSQEVSTAVPNTTSGIVAPVINKSTFQTSVVLADGEPLALGGIITTSYSLSKDRIPGLGQIPVVGALFGTNSRQTARTELVLVLTPHVQQNLAQAAAQTQAFIDKMRETKKDMDKMN